MFGSKRFKEKWLFKLKNKYRLVIMDDDNFAEKFSFRLSRLNVFVAVGSLAIILILLTTYIIAFTPLREYIPGYTSVELTRQSYQNALRADSLKRMVENRDRMLQTLNMVLSGEIPIQDVKNLEDTNLKPKTVDYKRSREDSLFRIEMENTGKYDLTIQNESSNAETSSSGGLSSFFFFSPIKGIVINGFNISKKHYGVDVAGKKNEPIKSILNGTVIFSNWTLETGYTIAIQHQQNLISVYKHNSALLKKAGEYVKAGEPVAFIGNSGEQTSGPHLHFELWFNGSPVNPRDYISF